MKLPWLQFILLGLILLAARCFAQTCGGPTYACGMHQTAAQLSIIPLPNPIPSVGNLVGANQTWTATAYGTTILRCTDVNTYSGPNALHGYEETESGGSSDIEWNANGRLLKVMLANGGSNVVVPFDPVAFKCGAAIPGSRAPNGGVFSNHDPNTDYTITGTKVGIRTFDWTNPQTAPVSSPYFDWTVVCPGLPPAASITWHSPMWMPLDDSVFAISFSDRGGQDTAEWVAMYQPTSGGCQLWNTLTGIITANGFGLGGKPSTFYPFTVHDIQMSYSGVLQVSIGGTCTGCPIKHGPWLFKAGGLQANMILCDFGGHNSIGYEHYINAVNEIVFAVRDWANPCPATIVDPAHIAWPTHTDSHVSWSNVDVLDSYGFMVGTTSLNQPQPLVITSPLENENVIVNFNGTFTRVSPTMDSGVTNPYNFRTVNAIGSLSKQGYYAWSSDWMGTLGNTDSVTATCTLGAAVPNACRSDVFVVIPK